MWLLCAWPSQEDAEGYVFGSDERHPGYSFAVVPAAAQGVTCSEDPLPVFHWDAALMPIGTTWMACTPLSRTVHEYFPFQQTSYTCTLAAQEDMYIHTYKCAHIHIYAHTSILMYIHTYIRTYIHMYTHTHIYMYLYMLGRGVSEWVSEDESKSNFILCNLASKYVVSFII